MNGPSIHEKHVFWFCSCLGFDTFVSPSNSSLPLYQTMFRRIAPKATKGKGRSWKAHQSSSSNPETTKFRAKAKLMRLQNLAIQAGHSAISVDFKTMSLTEKSKTGSTSSLKKFVKVSTAIAPVKNQKRKRKESVMEEEEDVRSKKPRKQGERSRPQSEDEFSCDDSEDERQNQKGEVVKSRGIYRDTSKKKKDESGSQYRAKKAAGDMKKNGVPDPYAYLPLDRKALKKRGSIKDQFKGLIGAARKGAIIGQKLRHRRNKK